MKKADRFNRQKTLLRFIIRLCHRGHRHQRCHHDRGDEFRERLPGRDQHGFSVSGVISALQEVENRASFLGRPAHYANDSIERYLRSLPEVRSVERYALKAMMIKSDRRSRMFF